MLILSEFEGVNFFNCYLAARQPTLGQYNSPDINHCSFEYLTQRYLGALQPG